MKDTANARKIRRPAPADRRRRASSEENAATLPSSPPSTRARRSPRRNLALGVLAAILGASAGTALALVIVPSRTPPSTLASAQPPPAPSPPPPSPTVTPLPVPSTPEPPATNDAHPRLISQIKTLLTRFLTWSDDHPGARCPAPATLGISPLDPWGSPLRIVCSDQPADQIAGVLSFGPDRLPGTPDDITSWTLGPDVTDLIRGPRWTLSKRGTRPKRARPPPPPAAAAAPTPAAAPTKPATGSSDPGDGIPDRR